MGGYRQYQIWTRPVPPIAAAIAIGWFTPLSEPVRIDPPAAPYGQVTTGAGVPPAGVTTNWYSPLSTPVQIEPGLSAAWTQYYSGPLVPATTTDLRNYWYSPLSEPVRAKKSVPWQQAFTTSWGQPVPRSDSWFKWFSEPVRAKKAVPWQQSFTIAPPPVFTQFWFNPLSEPVRIEPGLSAAWMGYYSAPQVATAVPSIIYSALSEPTWRDPPAAPYGQVTTGAGFPAAATFNTYWYAPLSEPVRSKKAVAWQQPFAMDWKWSAPVSVTYTFTLNVTETGDTGALTFSTQSLVMGANVTITEIRVGDLATATVTETELRANVTITEIPVGNLAYVTISELD